jgi:predicted phage tail protein
MNTSPDDLDAELLAHFRHPSGSLPHDPFVATTARRIAAARRSRRYVRNALQAGAVAALILGSRWLIQAASLASMKLDAWFAAGFDWLLTPLGTTIILTGIVGGVLLAMRRRALRLR